MGIWNQRATSNKDFGEPAPAGTHPAVLIALVDLGTHDVSYGEKKSQARKVLLAWELTGEDGRPVLARDYTLSFNQKATLRKIIEKWRGKSFQDGEDFDLPSILGKPCLVTVEHGQSSQSGRTYAKITDVTGVPKGMQVPKASRTSFGWGIGEGEYPNPDWMPFLYGERVADVIQRSPEWLEWKLGNAAPDSKGNTVPDAVGQFDEPAPVIEDGIPF